MDGKLGRFRLVKRLAAGGMSDIFLGQVFGPRGYEQTVVVKTIRGDLVEDQGLRQLLIDEARLASCLHHENIVRVLEVGVFEKKQFIAMEFVFGRDLRRIQERCIELGISIPAQHLVTIIFDVLSALDYAHRDAKLDGQQLEIVHRDVSPQNILVGFDGHTKLLDFGLAKAAAQISKTHAGVLKGKYAYMAPEQARSRNIDRRADVFSTGIVLWEMQTGQRLFLRSNDYETVRAVAKCRIPFVWPRHGAIPLSLIWATFWALKRSPRWRFQSAEAMKNALGRGRPIDQKTARNELADWIRALFNGELLARENALAKARSDPTRFRQIRDAGLELIEEATDPDAFVSTANYLPSPSARVDTPHSASSLLSAERWFIALFLSFVLICAGIGIYFGQFIGPSKEFGYLDVRSDIDGVVVVVGKRRIGKTPLVNVPVLPGSHQVIGESAKGRRQAIVDIKGGERHVVRLKFESSD